MIEQRKCVGILLLNKDNLIFCGQRSPNTQYLQMPQGGVDDGESYIDAAKRELYEETSIVSIEVLHEMPGYKTYTIPEDIIKAYGLTFKGQKQKWFIFKMIGDDSEINVNTEHPEFINWKWDTIDNICAQAISFKQELYGRVKDDLHKYLTTKSK